MVLLLLLLSMVDFSISFDLPGKNIYTVYSAKFWQGKTLPNLSKRDFGEENFGECVKYLLARGKLWQIILCLTC